jgi:RHS repeat-associated protein
MPFKGCYHVAYPVNPYHFDQRDGRIYAAQGYGSRALHERYLYDGWNLLAALNGTNNAVVKSFLWGSDLSGSEQGAGGVGGLLLVNLGSAGCAFPAYDGNGNVSGLVSASDGTLTAQYEYGPFGELLRANGALAKANPFRFSTKFRDEETDLLYYGYRYLSTVTGRWQNRDPIEEDGGFGVYSAVRNDPVSYIDALGLSSQLSYIYERGSYQNDGCGRFSFAVLWQLTPPSMPGGHIVQRVNARIVVKDCAGRTIKSDRYVFREAWEVKSAQGPFGLPILRRNQIKFDGRDIWRNGCGGTGTRGFVVVSATAQYLEGLTQLPSDWVAGNTHPRVVPKNPIPSTPLTTRPLSGAPSNQVKRSFAYSWDCCCGRERQFNVRPKEFADTIEREDFQNDLETHNGPPLIVPVRVRVPSIPIHR